jgi:hypothetical protein
VCYFTLPDVAVKVIAWFYFEALHISNAWGEHTISMFQFHIRTTYYNDINTLKGGGGLQKLTNQLLFSLTIWTENFT